MPKRENPAISGVRLLAAAPGGVERVVAIGDLNGAADALEQILRGTGVVNDAGRWAGGRTHLLQLGDLFNRGSGGRAALEWLLRLASEARRVGGRVTVLAGNHEVMTALGHEGYCTEGEYLSFATAVERELWPLRVRRMTRRLMRAHGPRGPILPIGPRLELWKIANVPGRVALRRALSAHGRLGRALRRLPVAARNGETVFLHAGVSPEWARLGVNGLNHAARAAWRTSPAFYGRVSRTSLLRAVDGPLWYRALSQGIEARVAEEFERVLELLGAERMVVGHTRTEHIEGGELGRIQTRFGGRLVCIDVGLQSGPGRPRTALLIDSRGGWEWTPGGLRRLWRAAAVTRRIG